MDEGFVTYGSARFAFTGDSRNVHVLDVHRSDLLGLVVLNQEIETRVSTLYYPEAGVLVPPALSRFYAAGQRSKNRAFSASGQSDNPEFQLAPSFLLSCSLEARAHFTATCSPADLPQKRQQCQPVVCVLEG